MQMQEVLLIVGVIFSLIGGIGFIIAAFRVSILWGLGCFLPFVPLIFLVSYWEESKNPFFIQLVGVALIFGSALLTN